MDSFLLARWQFGITTGYHFLFVPLTLGTGFLTAVLQTMWLRSGRECHLLAAKFWGELFLINFVLGVATGIVQEFQSGMPWGEHSRLVGHGLGLGLGHDFGLARGLGAPPAVEGLLAFLFDATFLGLWILGWDRLPRGVHTACVWLAACGIALSAYSGAPLAFAHTLAAAFLASGTLLVAASAWHLRHDRFHETMPPSMRVGLYSTLFGGAGTTVVGYADGETSAGRRPTRSVAAATQHPLIAATDWGSHLTIGFGLLAALVALFGLWHTRASFERGGAARFLGSATWLVPLGTIGAGLGWILTEAGRRVWTVDGTARAAHAHSYPDLHGVGAGLGIGAGVEAKWAALIVLTLLYALLAAVEVGLTLRTARRGPAVVPAPDGDAGSLEPELGFAY